MKAKNENNKDIQGLYLNSLRAFLVNLANLGLDEFLLLVLGLSTRLRPFISPNIGFRFLARLKGLDCIRYLKITLDFIHEVF